MMGKETNRAVNRLNHMADHSNCEWCIPRQKVVEVMYNNKTRIWWELMRELGVSEEYLKYEKEKELEAPGNEET